MKTMLLGTILGLIATAGAFAQSQPPASRQSSGERQAPQDQSTKNQSPPTALQKPVATLPENERTSDTHENKTEKEASKWSDPVTWFTGGLLLVSGLQAFVYWRQWRVMKDGLDETKKAANAAKDTVETMERNARKQLRAYVTLEFGMDEKAEDPKNETFTFYIKNSGQTPALNLHSCFGWRTMTGANARWPKGEAPSGEVVDISGSKAPLSAGGVTPLHSPIDQVQNPANFRQALIDANLGKCALFFVGRIFYDDVFGEKRTTDYCMTHIAGKPLGHTLLCAENNSST